MENIRIEKEVKYWPSVGKYCVAMTLPDHEYWSENGWDEDVKKAELIALGHVKKHILFIREMKAASEKTEITIAL